MKIRHLVENQQTLLEGGNLSIGSNSAEQLDLKVTNRSYMVPRLNALLGAIDTQFKKMYKIPLWNPDLLKSGEFLSGSSLHFFNVSGISDETFVAKKPTVGDIDTMVNKELEPQLQEFLVKLDNKQIGSAKLLGFQRGNEQFSALFEMKDPPVKIQIDFEFVDFENDRPTDWARFSHSSSWDDLQAGVKGVFHKWLIQAFTALTRKEFLLRKLVGRGKLRKEEDVPTTDNMYSFAVSSKEGGGLRAKYEPVLNDNGTPLIKDGLPVMREAPTAGYQKNIGKIFSTILDQRLTPKQAQMLQQKFWSFTGLLDVMNTLMDPEEKQKVLTGFLQKTIGPGAQGMYKNNPDKDIAEKTTAINTMLKTLNLPKPSNFDQMMNVYRQSYKMTPVDDSEMSSKATVKAMAKNTLDEAEGQPNYKRQGIQHIYNPGSSTEMKDLEFIDFVKEIAQDGGKFEGVPINLKVDGAGIRFGKTSDGKPFFMTSRVDTPMTSDNIGDFEKFGISRNQSPEQLVRTKSYDLALKTIVTADFMKNIPPDTIVQAEMLFNPMAEKDGDGYKFVNITYDPKKLGKIMTLVPISVKEFSTGQPRPDSNKIKQALIKDSTPNIKMVNNTLSHKGIDVSRIIAPIIKNEQALTNALSVRGDNPAKQQAKAVLSQARQALSNAIINSPIPGKDQLGDTMEGLVINMPSGRLAKVTSTQMKDKMAAKQLATKKPTTGSNRVKPAVVTIGSFVGHKGHQQLINQTIQTAKTVGGDPYIYVSPVMNAVDDPISPEDKVATLQKLYPQYAKNIQVWDLQGSPMKKIEKELVLPTNSPYNKIILLVGEDRYEGMKGWMDSLEKRMKDPAAVAKYGGTQNQVDFETVRTDRDPSKGGTGISFTQLRNVLKDTNKSEEEKLQFWMQAFDGETLGQDWIKHLMNVTAKNMGVSQQQAAIKEYIERVKPLLPHATPEQKAKIYESLAKAKAKLSEAASIERKESFRGRVTPDIEYIVRDDEGNIVRYCKTKKEARMWYDMVTLSKEEMWAKYPELKVNEVNNQHGVAEGNLDEGVNDPHIFKCIFLFGPMGAGKSTVARPLLSHTGLRSVNLDNFNEMFIKKGQVPTGHLSPDQLEKSWQLSQTQQQNFMDGRLGVIIDGSGRNPSTAIGVIEKLQPLGYEFMMIFVNVSEATSIARQQSRAEKQQQQWGVGRQVDPTLAKNTYAQVQKNLERYSAYFGPQRFIYVDNENAPNLSQATKKVDAFLNAPVNQPAAIKWIQAQKGGQQVAQKQQKLATAQDRQQQALKQFNPLNPKFIKQGVEEAKKKKKKKSSRSMGGYFFPGYAYYGGSGEYGDGGGGGESVAEAFDQPYSFTWEKSEYGDVDALATLSDGSHLSIMFEHTTPYEVNVSFWRNNSLAVTGEGDAQRVFATVLAAIQEFLKVEQPANISFSASKEVESGQNSESRAKLYNRLVQRYATSWGYKSRAFDHGNEVVYELVRTKNVDATEGESSQGVAEGSEAKDDLIWMLNNFDYYTDNGSVYVNDAGEKIARYGSNWKHQSGKIGRGAEELGQFLSSKQELDEDDLTKSTDYLDEK
jgi:adenylate kinase family enzyme